jgi:hypothetical protein
VDGGVRVLRVVVVKGQALGLVTCNHDSWLQAMAQGGGGGLIESFKLFQPVNKMKLIRAGPDRGA